MNPFDSMYEDRTPPWEIGRPQGAIVAAADKVRGRVLDLGCGTGENAIFFAKRGCEVIGVDGARAAIAAAKRKAAALGLTNVDFLVHDALAVTALARQFDAAIDSGFFHTLSDEGRNTYREELKNVLVPGATVLVLCFSEHEPDWGGPRRVRAEELRATFGAPFFVESITEARYETNLDQHLVTQGARAWLAAITFVGASAAALS
jgi:cyclopropane fatty-acyl-phospholipid synthase-like methyltransferase